MNCGGWQCAKTEKAAPPVTLARHRLKYSAGPMVEYKAMKKETKWQNVTCMKG